MGPAHNDFGDEFDDDFGDEFDDDPDLDDDFGLEDEIDEFGGVEEYLGTSPEEFAADMELDEAEIFGVGVGLAMLIALWATAPVAMTGATAAGGVGVAALIKSMGAKSKYIRQATRLVKLCLKGKVGTRRWNRNVKWLNRNWRKLQKRGKTGGLQPPDVVVAEARKCRSSQAFRKAKAVQARPGRPVPVAQMQVRRDRIWKARHRRAQLPVPVRRRLPRPMGPSGLRPVRGPRPVGGRPRGWGPSYGPVRSPSYGPVRATPSRGGRRYGPSRAVPGGRGPVRAAPSGRGPIRAAPPSRGPSWTAPPSRGGGGRPDRGGGGRGGGGQSMQTIPSSPQPSTNTSLQMAPQRDIDPANLGAVYGAVPVAPDGYTFEPTLTNCVKSHPISFIAGALGLFALGVAASDQVKGQASATWDRQFGR